MTQIVFSHQNNSDNLSYFWQVSLKCFLTIFYQVHSSHPLLSSSDVHPSNLCSLYDLPITSLSSFYSQGFPLISDFFESLCSNADRVWRWRPDLCHVCWIFCSAYLSYCHSCCTCRLSLSPCPRLSILEVWLLLFIFLLKSLGALVGSIRFRYLQALSEAVNDNQSCSVSVGFVCVWLL